MKSMNNKMCPWLSIFLRIKVKIIPQMHLNHPYLLKYGTQGIGLTCTPHTFSGVGNSKITYE